MTKPAKSQVVAAEVFFPYLVLALPLISSLVGGGIAWLHLLGWEPIPLAWEFESNTLGDPVLCYYFY
jgi:hypothetical protein